MTIIQVEHSVPNYEGWKRSFDNDPINRKKSGVSRYSIYRAVDDPNYVYILLEFNGLPEANDFKGALHTLWGNIEGKIISKPQSRMFELVETADI